MWQKKDKNLCFLYMYQWLCEAGKFNLILSMKRSHEHRNIREGGQLFSAQGHQADWSTAASKPLSSAQSCFDGGSGLELFVCPQAVRQSQHELQSAFISTHFGCSQSFHSPVQSFHSSVCIPQPWSWRKYRLSKYSLRTYDKTWINVRQGLVCINTDVLINQWP